MAVNQKDRVLELLRELPQEQRAEIAATVLAWDWPGWEDGPAAARRAARSRGLDWDLLTDEQRMQFVDDLIHEDRP